MTVSLNEDLVADFSRFYILTILYEQPQHGYAIIRIFKERTGKEISPCIVYPFLRQLEKYGWVTQSLKIEGIKKKIVFELTAEGKEKSRQLFKRFFEITNVAIESSLTACAHCGCKIFEGAYKGLIQGKEIVFCCIHCAESFKKEQLNIISGVNKSVSR